MKRLFTLLILAATMTTAIAQDEADPVADPSAVVTSGRARFTVLTPQMIRIQFSTTQRFEDRATFAVVNRRLPVPSFTTREEGGYLYIQTDSLLLRYRVGSSINPAMKSPNYLSITFRLGGRDVIWYPGKDDALNLRGTKRTLDTASGDNQRPDMEPGIISRAGWALLDESPQTTRGDGSTTFAFDGQQDSIQWWAEPVDKRAIDWYFFGYGHDYRRALADYVSIAGRQPMPPLYALGYWYSKYQRYSQQDFINLTNEIKKNEIPIDVMIMDMDWHLDGWTGWTWNQQLIPNPEGLIRWMHQQGLKVSLNLHPADGIASYEDHFSDIRSDLGLSGVDRVPWNLEDGDFYRSFFRHIIREREQQGVDFWWLDWQQNLTSNFVSGLSETFWCNHVFFNDMRLQRPDRRPMIFHRWGGMGSHRYPIGFSGDTYGTYGSLAFQPYFTATASNVCFGYWGHDLGGHMQIGQKNPELMLRWLQFGAFSPIMRTHGASQAGNERRIWMYPNFDDMLQAVQLRYRLMPYIYTAARQAYDTGVSICRPLYYDWPEEKEAYRREGQYMFGDDILVSPIVTESDDGLSTFHQTWLPTGTAWYDVCRRRLVSGGQTLSDNYALTDIPYFLRAGAVVPCNPDGLDNLKSAPAELVVTAAPGANGAATLYEDEGDTQGYTRGLYATTRIEQSAMSTQARSLTIMPREGAYDGMPAERAWTVRFLGHDAEPQRVTVNGQPTDQWTYDAPARTLTVSIPATPCSERLFIGVDEATDGIETVQSPEIIVHSYDLLGRPVTESHRGAVTIQRSADGRVRKVVTR